ncbi:uncharacterized protein Ecym_1197 [Eremothecium cymbalariae DBVPG|uniref:YbgI/family dinuclear metal center protein n=1 Tax=Eremothecium cymbalariae (strain CBS 270.75 / DBVPG 7215 / KCTC 17166 / NRRL Y-17582) TaxID=931890 RepID=G8JMY1_ERECY|nr:hypothetical protein Ecym_1197 [Eremothecium cymbalariae DBVPG\
MNSSKVLSRTQLKAVLQTIKKLYPPQYADSAWDNTGLLIDCSVESLNSTKPKIMLTVDLTSSVAQEAIDKGCNVILTYHPFIFPHWKKLDPWDNSQHQSAIKLIQNSISVYSPHTAVDAANIGVNNWLAYSLVAEHSIIESITAIERVSPVQGEQEHEVGYGRLVKLKQPLPLATIIQQVKKSLNIPHLQVATKNTLDSHMIQSVALCAGSGSSVFKHLKEPVDLYYTGELSHHEILRYREDGKAVILCNHSNTERAYLKDTMYHLLTTHSIECEISDTDVDPLYIV